MMLKIKILNKAKQVFLEILNIKKGGLAIYGGVIGGVIGIVIFCLIKKNFKIIIDLLDVLAPCLILGQAIGRWGNFINQEAYGNLVTNKNLQWFPFAVWIEDCNQTGCLCGATGSGWHYATFFYESLWNIIGAILLLIIYNKSKTKGTTTAMYFIWYDLRRTK